MRDTLRNEVLVRSRNDPSRWQHENQYQMPDVESWPRNRTERGSVSERRRSDEDATADGTFQEPAGAVQPRDRHPGRPHAGRQQRGCLVPARVLHPAELRRRTRQLTPERGDNLWPYLRKPRPRTRARRLLRGQVGDFRDTAEDLRLRLPTQCVDATTD